MIRLLRDYPIYQLKVTLIGSKPAIWRRFQVKKDTTLRKLHDILQIVMGWDDAHLHEFRSGELRFGEPVPEEDYDVVDERGVKLSQVAPNGPITFEYLYDFGDGWEHEVSIESGVDKKTGVRYPACIEGVRACPPEDVGAMPGMASSSVFVRRQVWQGLSKFLA